MLLVDTSTISMSMFNSYWVVVWNMTFIFPYIGNVIIPIDELLFFRGVAQTPTSVEYDGKGWEILLVSPREIIMIMIWWERYCRYQVDIMEDPISLSDNIMAIILRTYIYMYMYIYIHIMAMLWIMTEDKNTDTYNTHCQCSS